VFVHGQLYNGPFTCLEGDGWGRSVSQMRGGRPAEGSVHTYFYHKGAKQHVDLLEEKTEVEGWQGCSIQVDKERRYKGRGK
jgi:hypothetical protein